MVASKSLAACSPKWNIALGHHFMLKADSWNRSQGGDVTSSPEDADTEAEQAATD